MIYFSLGLVVFGILLWYVAGLMIMIHAFQQRGVFWGILTFPPFVPTAIYWLFARYNRNNKKLVIALYFVAIAIFVIGFSLYDGAIKARMLELMG